MQSHFIKKIRGGSKAAATSKTERFVIILNGFQHIGCCSSSRSASEDDKKYLKNCGPVPLLPICGKVLERLMFNEMLRFLIKNNLISSNQFGFKPEDSCINRLLSITHEIYESFVDGFEVRDIFFDISKVFETVWHKAKTKWHF